MEKEVPEMSPTAEFDFVIVGAGSAGCLLANRLSANPDHRVLLIEAGGKDNYFWIKVPVAICTQLPTHAPTGASRPRLTQVWPAAASTTRAAA